MSAPRKYTDEQRQKAIEMYWEDRPAKVFEGEYRKGKYTLREIEKQTGIPRAAVWKIAHELHRV